MGAALVNDVFTKGLDVLSKLIIPGLNETSTFVATTSDDSVRAVCCEDKTLNIEKVLDDYITLPI
jgi:hypothetical protein